MLYAGRLAISPSRVLTAFFLLVMLGALVRIPDLFATYASDGIAVKSLPSDLAEARSALMHEQLRDDRYIAAAQTFVGTPVALLRAHPQWILGLLLPAAVLWGLLGGVISRGASIEFALGTSAPWSKCMGQALSRWQSLAMATLGPLLLAAIVLAVLPVFGKLLDVRGVQYVAGALYVVPLLLSFLAAGLVIVFLLSLPMLVAGVMSEGGEALEAVQRAFAYVLAQPARLAGALLVLSALGVALLALTTLLTQLSLYTSSQLTTLWVSESTREALASQAMRGEASEFGGATGAVGTTGMLVGFWVKLALAIAPSVLVSFVFCAGSVLYLSMRQAVDGQHLSDIWDPAAGPRVIVPATVESDSGDGDDA